MFKLPAPIINNKGNEQVCKIVQDKKKKQIRISCGKTKGGIAGCTGCTEGEIKKKGDDEDGGGGGGSHFPSLQDYSQILKQDEQLSVLWTRPRIKTFPCIKELEVPKETKEQRALRRLRSRLRPFKDHPRYYSAAGESDKILLAWLMTFDLNVFAVEARLKKHCETRLELKLDTILENYKILEALEYHYTGGLCGEDREKRPIWYELIGRLDMDSLVKSATREDLIKHKFHQLERLKKNVEKSEASQILVIVDMEGTPNNILGPALEIWREYITIVQDHYPYLVHEFIILHPSNLFADFTLNLRPYLNRLMRSKVTVLGRHYNKYLIQRIEKHQIPAYLGGYKCDVDNNQFCRENLNWDGEVPKWMYSYPHAAANVHSATIPGGERLVVETHVATAGSQVTWGFFSLSQPINMSIYVNRVAEDCCIVKEQRIDLHKSDDHISYVSGTTCEGSCRYLTVFNNGKNLASAARCVYKIDVEPPISLKARHAERQPLGDSFHMNKFIGEEESRWRQWKYSREPRTKWKQELPPIARIQNT